MHLQRFRVPHCCLCGSSERPTAEHKIKASALRREFGNTALVVGVSGLTASKMKAAQSTNSKHLKFKVVLCEACNSSRTQPADREFDTFHDLALVRVKNDEDPVLAFDEPRYSIDSEAYLNVFRYFAKVLCCHIAAVDGPIPLALAKFAIGQSQTNRIWLQLKRDATYRDWSATIGEHNYAAHGGLVVYAEGKTGNPNAFHSTITLGTLQYVFHTRLDELEKAELLRDYPDFSEWCRGKAHDAVERPIPDETLARLGLKDELF